MLIEEPRRRKDAKKLNFASSRLCGYSSSSTTHGRELPNISNCEAILQLRIRALAMRITLAPHLHSMRTLDERPRDT